MADLGIGLMYVRAPLVVTGACMLLGFAVYSLARIRDRVAQGYWRTRHAFSDNRHMELNWSVKNSKIVWDGRFPVIEDLLESDHDGREHLYTYLGIDSTAVGVVALDSRQRVLLVNEYRHPMGRVVQDIPMGTVERGENLREAAARELQEETPLVSCQTGLPRLTKV